MASRCSSSISGRCRRRWSYRWPSAATCSPPDADFSSHERGLARQVGFAAELATPLPHARAAVRRARRLLAPACQALPIRRHTLNTMPPRRESAAAALTPMIAGAKRGRRAMPTRRPMADSQAERAYRGMSMLQLSRLLANIGRRRLVPREATATLAGFSRGMRAPPMMSGLSLRAAPYINAAGHGDGRAPARRAPTLCLRAAEYQEPGRAADISRACSPRRPASPDSPPDRSYSCFRRARP